MMTVSLSFCPCDLQVMAEEKGQTSSRFLFPFKPYSIQEEFMTALYNVLEDGKIGIFESPTGTVSFNISR